MNTFFYFGSFRWHWLISFTCFHFVQLWISLLRWLICFYFSPIILPLSLYLALANLLKVNSFRNSFTLSKKGIFIDVTLFVSFTYILKQYKLVCFKFKFYISIILIRRSLYFVSFNVWIIPRTYSSWSCLLVYRTLELWN